MRQLQVLCSLFDAGIDAVSGHRSVERALRELPDFSPDQIVAVGKAAADMVTGAHALYGVDVPVLLATKHGHCDPALAANPAIEVIEAGHPVPDRHSLHAGAEIIRRVSSLREFQSLLLLVSGGASSIAESLEEGMTLADWQEMNRRLLAEGFDIARINARRKAVSRIKDGRLLAHFKGKEVVVCVISDVRGDDLGTIGSGIGDVSRCRAPHRVKLVASNRSARTAVAKAAAAMGLTVRHNRETLYGDVFELAQQIGDRLIDADPGVYIWGGEPTIVLPENPGEGGRNQSLALALADRIAGHANICLLVAGTDGTDGPTTAAGGIVDGNTVHDSAAVRHALRAADAGSCLEQLGARLVTGPTGTNVMDLLIAIVE